MQVQVKLMGMLKQHSPSQEVIEVPEGTTLEQLLRQLQVADEQVQVITINGRFELNRSRPLVAGDQVTVIPPVGGG